MYEGSDKIIHLNSNQIRKTNPINRKVPNFHTNLCKDRFECIKTSHITINLNIAILTQHQHKQKVKNTFYFDYLRV
jgi:hypothetical protein